MKVAIFQIDIHWENPDSNRKKIETLSRQLTTKPDLIILPEMFTTGFTMRAEAKAEKMGGETCLWLETFARKHECIVCGSLIIEENGAFFNRFIFTNGLKFQAFYDKRHLFRIAGENQVYSPGEVLLNISIKGWKIRPLICYDLRFPVWSRNQFSEAGEAAYDILIYTANWPQKRITHWNSLLLARAIENQAIVIGVNRVGEDGNGICYTGSSAVIEANGNYLFHDSEAEEGVFEVELHKPGLTDYRSKFPAWRDADSFRVGN